MSLVPALANGFRANPSSNDLDYRNALATQHSLLGVGVFTRVKKLDDGTMEVIVFRCTRELCVRTRHICDEDFCRQVEEDVQTRVASLHALKELDETHVVFEEGCRQPVS